jgi:RHS repeat-associated protein
VLHQAGTVTLDGVGYTYDNSGNRTAKTNYLNNVTENYTYDPLYQLTQVTQGATTTESYSYDAVGNRLSSQGMSPYAYNSSNELTSTPAATFTYDSNGNTLTKVDSSGTTTYNWDFENRLTSVMLPGTSGTVSFTYDPFGRRIRKSSTSGTINYLYDRANVIEESDASGNAIARYVQDAGIDNPLAEVRPETTSFYEADGLGSVTSLTNTTGTISNVYTYDAFGNLVATTGAVSNLLQYAGREYDQETRLYFLRSRYFDPAAGRFLNEDPLRWIANADFYAYTKNNPVRFTDPFGLIHQGPDGRLHDDAAGGLETLCNNPNYRQRDIEWLTQSIAVRLAELSYLGDRADAGHILRVDLEFATLARCNSSCQKEPAEKPTEEPESTWEKVKESVKTHKAEYGVLGVAVIIVVSVALAPETGGASLGGLALAF